VEPYVFVSGQIGLLPASLTLPSPPSFALETALAFQHTDRVIRAANTAGGHVLLALYWLADDADTKHTRRACEMFCEVSLAIKPADRKLILILILIL
jgi:diphthine-ammonia ligase